VNAKLVDADSGRIPVPWWYPYDGDGTDAFRGMIQVLYRSGLTAKAAAAWEHRRSLVQFATRYVSRS